MEQSESIILGIVLAIGGFIVGYLIGLKIKYA